MADRSPKFKPSHRGAHPSIAEQLHAKALTLEEAGSNIVYLQVGQPSTGAPSGVIEAVDQASHDSPMGYSGAAGLPQLKRRLSQQYMDLYGVEVEPERIIVTFGASGAMLLAIIGCFDVGQRIGLPQPFYYGYRHAMATLGVECVLFDTSMENNLQPTVADLEALDDPIDGLIVASPGNPTGSMIEAPALEALAQYCESRGIRFISDEIYHGITFDESIQEATACSFSEEAIVVNSFSKYYSMAGWRLGWMVVPDYLVEPISSLAHNLYLCPPTPAQLGALHALDCRPELDHHVVRYKRNRDILLESLPQLGFDRFTAPDGAFYLYCHVRHLHEDSVAFCVEMLENANVLVAPGSDFCPNNGQHYIRFSYAGATAQIEEAVHRIAKWRA
ncbi:MAG: aminotransferase class I/II-fold pyridoxal phosphate-dependent enzyme [Myxococcota bacterium]